MRDKAIQEMAEILFPIADTIVLTQVNNPRAATIVELVHAASRTGAPTFMPNNQPPQRCRRQGN